MDEYDMNILKEHESCFGYYYDNDRNINEEYTCLLGGNIENGECQY